jgi:hypothetical protein
LDSRKNKKYEGFINQIKQKERIKMSKITECTKTMDRLIKEIEVFNWLMKTENKSILPYNHNESEEYNLNRLKEWIDYEIIRKS